MNRKNHASLLRFTRKIHRTLGIFLFAFFMVVSISGLLLGWKKDSGGVLLPETMQGRAVSPGTWIPIASLQKNAVLALQASHPGLDMAIDRIDIRPEQGVGKVTFKAHYWEVQLALADADILHIAKRRSDFIENIHDGSIFDEISGTKGILKLIYTSILGIALFLFTVTGFWLWVGPKQMRRKANRHHETIKGTV